MPKSVINTFRKVRVKPVWFRDWRAEAKSGADHCPTAFREDAELRRAGLRSERSGERRLAERGGFEPPVPREQYHGLANRCFRPLSHLSSID